MKSFCLALIIVLAGTVPVFAQTSGEDIRYAIVTNIDALILVLTNFGNDQMVEANARNFIRTAKAPELPVPRDSVAVIGGRNPRTGEYFRRVIQANEEPVEKIWRDGLFPRLYFNGINIHLRYSNGETARVNPLALRALMKTIPTMAYKDYRGESYLYINSCKNMSSALSLLGLLGLQVTQENFRALDIDKETFDQWMQLYITIGNAAEMEYTSCNGPMYYVHYIWPGATGYNWSPGVRMHATSRAEEYKMSLTWKPDWTTTLTFKRHGMDATYWQIGIRAAKFVRGLFGGFNLFGGSRGGSVVDTNNGSFE